jgi:hypothetical protein
VLQHPSVHGQCHVLLSQQAGNPAGASINQSASTFFYHFCSASRSQNTSILTFITSSTSTAPPYQHLSALAIGDLHSIPFQQKEARARKGDYESADFTAAKVHAKAANAPSHPELVFVQS